MLLILTNTEDATADYLCSVLPEHGIEFVRWDTDAIVERATFSYEMGKPAVEVEGVSNAPDAFSNVWYRRPERLKDARFDSSPEGRYLLNEWAEALEGFFAHIPRPRWMNHPAANAQASHKLEQLTTAQSLGFRVPDTIVTQDEDVLRAFFKRHDGRVIVKPMSSGYIKRDDPGTDSLIYTNAICADDLTNLDDLGACPTLFQEYIAKQSDVRVTVVDQRLHAVQLLGLDAEGIQKCDIRRNNMDDVSYRKIKLPYELESLIRKLMERYGLRFGAIDMAVSQEGAWYFLEINPNGQWAWLDLSASLDIAASFVESFSDA